EADARREGVPLQIAGVAAEVERRKAGGERAARAVARRRTDATEGDRRAEDRVGPSHRRGVAGLLHVVAETDLEGQIAGQDRVARVEVVVLLVVCSGALAGQNGRVAAAGRSGDATVGAVRIRALAIEATGLARPRAERGNRRGAVAEAE